MKYKQRPGIVYTEICGEHYLIPTRSASEFCPHATRANFIISIIWGKLGSGRPVDDIYRAFQLLTRQPEEKVKKVVDKLLAELCRKGLLIVVEDEG